MSKRKSNLATALAAAALAIAGIGTAAAQSVVVYNTVSTKLMQAFVDDFQKANPGIKVDVISGGSGELLTRIKAEKANPRGDIFAGPDADMFDAEPDLFASYKSKEDAAFDRSAVGKDDKYYGFSTNFQTFIVNTKMMPLDKAPKSWADLAKPEFKGKIQMANPAQSGSAYSQMQQILSLYGWDMMAKIIQNATFVTSSKLAFQNVAKGEFPVGLTSEFNILVMKNEGNPVEAIYPSDGTALINDGNALIKGGEKIPRLHQLQTGPHNSRRPRQAALRAFRHGAAGGASRRQRHQNLSLRYARRGARPHGEPREVRQAVLGQVTAQHRRA